MKKAVYSILFLALLITLSACGTQGNGEASPAPSASGRPSSDSPQASLPPDGSQSGSQEDAEEDDSLPPEEGMARSRLTGEWVNAEVAATRPIAVIIPNEVNSIPHYNLSKASVLYEANVEGRMSRMMGIYEDWQGLEKIGNVRSLRTYFMYWAFEWDAFLVHYGGPYFINELIAEPNTQYIDGNLNADAKGFFRATDRSAPHNGYAKGSALYSVIRQKGYPLKYRGLSDAEHFRFADRKNPNTLSQYGAEAKSASYIDMSGCYPLTRCYFEYSEADGLYYRSQHLSGDTDKPHMDAATGEQLTFRNILVQYVKYENIVEGYLAFQCHDNTRDGWFFTGGKGIHVTWEKTSDYGATRYYDDYGNEVLLNTGKTMICIVEEDDNFTFR